LHIGVDSKDENQLFLLSNGGIANINCVAIEQYPPDIKDCLLNMVAHGELHLKPNEKSLRIDQDRSIYCYTIKLDEDFVKAEPSTRKVYFLVYLFVGKKLIKYPMNKLKKCSA
tara:strand:+ start:26289 stop:26627 length:339 start_codon:yes stop_codon:yes gene_type:complete